MRRERAACLYDARAALGDGNKGQPRLLDRHCGVGAQGAGVRGSRGECRVPVVWGDRVRLPSSHVDATCIAVCRGLQEYAMYVASLLRQTFSLDGEASA